MSNFRTLSTFADPTDPVPPGMVENRAGGLGFQLSDWDLLRRFLTLGTTGGTYYVKEHDLTKENVDCVDRCLAADAKRVVALAVDACVTGRVPSKDPALFVLAKAASQKVKRALAGGRFIDEPTEASFEALDVLPKVAGTFTDLAHFIAFLRGRPGQGERTRMRGCGNGFMKRVSRWYNDMPVERLALQVIKYQTRDGVSQRDVYNLAHPARWNAPSANRRAVFDFIVKGTLPQGAMASEPELALLAAYGQLQVEGARSVDAARLIESHGLPMEAIPTHLRDASVYEAVLNGFRSGRKGNSLTWLLRNLGNLGAHGVLTDARPDVSQFIAAQLTDEQALAKARIHPLAFIKALLTYRSGRGIKGSQEWPVVTRIVDALDAGFYKSFRYSEPSGKRLMLCIDVSGSMSMHQIGAFPSLSLHQAAAIMALSMAHVEPNWCAVAFDQQVWPIDISPRQRMDDVANKLAEMGGGGTDLGASMAYARRNRIPVDAFVLLTDDETWLDKRNGGSHHTHEELDLYRAEMGIPAKVVNVTMSPDKDTIVPPGDPGFLELVGFDSHVPSVISSWLAD